MYPSPPQDPRPLSVQLIIRKSSARAHLLPLRGEFDRFRPYVCRDCPSVSFQISRIGLIPLSLQDATLSDLAEARLDARNVSRSEC